MDAMTGGSTMRLKFIGVGSAFTTPDYWQSNMLLTSDDGKRMMIDCGADARHSMREQGLTANDVDAVYISHCHSDHVGGMEWLALSRYFNKGLPRPKLFIVEELVEYMWEHALRAGLETIEGKVTNLTDFFDCQPVELNGSFRWGYANLIPVQTVHTMAGYKIQKSYGLIIRDESPKPIKGQPRVVFLTTDTQYCPTQIRCFYEQADVIFHDCETVPFRSGVHAHYDDMRKIDEKYKAKMWLYHYQPNPQQDPVKDGFKGFIRKGQEFEI